jgi:hypothetical protein
MIKSIEIIVSYHATENKKLRFLFFFFPLINYMLILNLGNSEKKQFMGAMAAAITDEVGKMVIARKKGENCNGKEKY